MNNKPILFSTSMVQAIIEGRKTQTRRVMKKQPCYLPDFNQGNLSINIGGSRYQAFNPAYPPIKCPHGKIGDYLWVRETWAPLTKGYAYKADPFINYSPSGKWHPSIHMPKAASRITLLVEGIRVERLQDISEEDAMAEGAESWDVNGFSEETICLLDSPVKNKNTPYINGFSMLWQSINGIGSWEMNPWVWVIDFDLILKNINDVIGESCQTSK